MNIRSAIEGFKKGLQTDFVKLIAVSKMHPSETILEAYDAGQKIFGENKVQELLGKYEVLPKDIEWHLIGHLQSNKAKYVVPFVHLIHSIDSFKLLREINKEAEKINRKIHCLLQIHIAQEETKFGFLFHEAEELLKAEELKNLRFVKIVGLMGMASNVDDEYQVRAEFRGLKKFFDQIKKYKNSNIDIKELSMGMSSDYKIAIQEGSTMIRIGSALFGSRNY